MALNKENTEAFFRKADMFCGRGIAVKKIFWGFLKLSIEFFQVWYIIESM